MEGCMAVNSEGKSSGLALMLKERVKITLQNYSKYHIDSLVSLDNGNELRFTGFYGQANLNLRKESWDMLRRVKRTVKEGWIVGGDFNAIFNNVENEGGRKKPRCSMDEFCDILDELDLVDVKTDSLNSERSTNLLKSARGKLGHLYDVQESYFHDLFKTSIDPDEEIDLQVVPESITDSMNNTLDK
ncbi:hypothetical protein GOBAR_AA39697 [Gossypium barbadense]|uniref:Endonuclease/exonuclease/phosphatase domain-containing protein n=1 Tax=Gossypium barbadense TaxID=3634 RepID=A0A2P5VQC8_GOSBA|nr:hypothetical protein GOBAR_AA39697 [Gossypium barbadense]